MGTTKTIAASEFNAKRLDMLTISRATNGDCIIIITEPGKTIAVIEPPCQQTDGS